MASNMIKLSVNETKCSILLSFLSSLLTFPVRRASYERLTLFSCPVKKKNGITSCNFAYFEISGPILLDYSAVEIKHVCWR